MALWLLNFVRKTGVSEQSRLQHKGVERAGVGPPNQNAAAADARL